MKSLLLSSVLLLRLWPQQSPTAQQRRNDENERGRKRAWLSCTTLSLQIVACITFVLAGPYLVNAVDISVGAGDVAGLIAAINRANTSGDESNRITLEPGTYTLTRVNNNTDGPNGLPSITSVLTISVSGSTAIGPSGPTATIRRGVNAPPFRILHVSGALALFNITISGGNADTGDGGGIFNRGRITFLFFSTVSNNRADSGGGIFNSGGFLPGILNVFGSTIASNTGRTGGGGNQ